MVAFFAYLFWLSTGITFESNLPTKITDGDIDGFFYNHKLYYDGAMTALQFTKQVFDSGKKYCILSIKNWSEYSVQTFLPQKFDDLS